MGSMLIRKCSDSTGYVPLNSVFTVGILICLEMFFIFPARADDSRPACQSEQEDALRIVVAARRETIESDSMHEGVLTACVRPWVTPVHVSLLVYDDKGDGFRKISALVKSGEADIIIGPTESRVYSDLVEFLDFGERPVPIISPVVTLRTGNEKDGWFFRTNVDAANRAQTMYDFLAVRGIENFAMLYIDRTFGEIAETAFRAELTESQREKYRTFRFVDSEDARQWIRQIAAERPEAVGILGARHDVKQVSPMITRPHAEWNAYDPYVFTILDTRALEADGIYFLSVAPGGEALKGTTEGEVLDLAYDTTSLVMRIADDMLTRDITPRDPDWRLEFRTRLIGAMSGSLGRAQTRTGMEFSGLRNVATPSVMKLENRKAVTVTASADASWITPVINWLDIRKRRFGIAPLLNIALITFIVLLLTVVDLRRSHGVHSRDLVRPPFLMLMLLNAATASLLFVVMAEQSVLEWDSLLGGLLVAFGYAGLLKTSVFETETGEAIGAKRYYDKLVVAIYDRIRRSQFELYGPVINYIAYTNSKTYLRAALKESYGFAREKGREKVLTDRLDASLEKEQTTIGGRKVLARAVLNEISWPKMVEKRIVPPGLAQQDLEDPEPLLDLVVEGCMKNCAQILYLAREAVYLELENSTLRTEFEEEYEKGTTPRSKLLACFRWLMLLKGYEEDMLSEGKIPELFGIAALTETVVETVLESVQQAVSEGQIDEKRKSVRVGVWDNMEITCGETRVDGTLLNVSTGGGHLHTHENADIANEILVTSSGEDVVLQVVDSAAEILEQITRDDGTIDMRFRWKNLTESNKNNLDAYITSLTDGRV